MHPDPLDQLAGVVDGVLGRRQHKRQNIGLPRTQTYARTIGHIAHLLGRPRDLVPRLFLQPATIAQRQRYRRQAEPGQLGNRLECWRFAVLVGHGGNSEHLWRKLSKYLNRLWIIRQLRIALHRCDFFKHFFAAMRQNYDFYCIFLEKQKVRNLLHRCNYRRTIKTHPATPYCGDRTKRVSKGRRNL